MANPQDLEKLCQGPKVWNAWREEDPYRVPDLREAVLTLGQRQFGPSNGGPINLQDVDLGGVQLHNATLSGADLSHASLIGAGLVHARLDNANFSHADLTDAILDHADLTDAKLDGAILIGASLLDVRGLTQDQLASAFGNATTALPLNLTPPESWFPSLDDEVFGSFGDYTPPPIHHGNPYDILGVERTASSQEIRAAFRNLVKKVHPDLNPGDPDAQETFKRVSIAYGILGNPDKRRRYDRGEIGGDGEVTQEFEAKQQFRRYAYRYYAAAAASLCLAAGVLATVWYSVLTDDVSRNERVEITVAAPPKQHDRLGNASKSSLEHTGNSVPLSNAPDLKPATADRPSELERALSEPSLTQAGSEADLPTSPAQQKTADAENGPPTLATALVSQNNDERDQTLARDHPPSGPIIANSDPSQPSLSHSEVNSQHSQTSARPVQPIASKPPTPPLQQTQTTNRSAAAVEVTVITPIEPETRVRTPVDKQGAGTTTIIDQGSGQTALPQNKSSPDTRTAAADPGIDKEIPPRPLGQDHSEKEARPAEADTASLGASENSGAQRSEESESSQKRESKNQNQDQDVQAEPAHSPHSEFLLRRSKARAIARDPISDLLIGRAVRNTMAPGDTQSMASVDGLSSGEETSDQEEIWDVYTHLLPDHATGQDQPWPEILTRKKAEKRALPPVPALSTTAPVVSTPEVPEVKAQQQPEATRRKQAVSDILSGGL